MFRHFYAALTCLLLAGLGSVSAQGVFFSETFTGSIPNTWTNRVVQGNNQPSSRWVFSTAGPQGSFAIDPVASTTGSTGFALFDSDLNCSHPNPQDAWLISPAINASNKQAVFLQFQTFYRSFNDRPQVRVGTNLNDLNSWATFEVFPGITANAFGGVLEGNANINPQLLTVDISEFAAGQANVYFAFQFLSTSETANGGNLTGCGYAWMVDDVILTDENPRPDNDMRVNAFYAVAPNAITPASQLEPIGFIADVANVGNQAQPSSKLTMTIVNEQEAVVFRDSLIYGNIASDSTAENVFFNNEYLPPASNQLYTATYNLSFANEDEVPANNSQSFIFAVSDTLFAKEVRATRGVAPAASSSYTYGNVFYVPNGNGLFARYIGFGVSNVEDVADQEVSIFLYRWEGDTNGDLTVNTEETELLGFNSYTFTGEEGDELIWVSANEDGAIALEDDYYYIPVVQYQDVNQVDFFLQASEDFDYAAMNFYTDSLGRPRYGAALNVGNSDEELSLVGFGLDIVPVVRMSIGADINVSTKETLLAADAVQLFPNPVSELATLSFRLSSPVQALVKVYNAAGQLVLSRTLAQVQNEQIQLSVNELPAGNYTVRIETAQGNTSLKMTVQR